MSGVPEHVRYWEAGYEAAMFGVCCLVLELRQHNPGAADGHVLDAILSMAELRLAAGAEDPIGQLTGEGDGHGT